MKHSPTWHFTVLLTGWSATAVCAAVAHLALPLWTAQGTVWPSSAYWQSEIAYFDLLLAVTFIWIARQPDRALKVKACWAIAFLSLALGHNHLEGWLASSNEPKIFHVVFTLGNLLAFVWGIACLVYEKINSLLIK
jgi:hypothetical protein